MLDIKKMRKIQRAELMKLRSEPDFKYHSFVYLNEITEARRRLKLSEVKYKTVKKFENGILIGYKVYVA